MKGSARTTLWFALLAAALLVVFLLNIGFGSTNMTFTEIVDTLFGAGGAGDAHEANYLIIQKIRLPRALASIAGGAAIAIAGLLLQTFFNNPIVEPYVLGISSGSMLFVGMVIMGGWTFGLKHISPLLSFAGAFAGAMLVMAVVLFAARRVKSIITLLVIGLMAGYLCGALTNILSAFADKEQIARFSLWSMGSFSGFTWQQVRILYAIVLPMLGFTFLLAKPLNALGMGERYAASMGVNAKLLRTELILISSVLTAATSAFAGPISFIGLAVPHICRILMHTSNSRILIPAVILGGALMAGLCDFIARTIMAPVEIPLGAVTALAGAPIVVWLLTRRAQ
ncbi:MAG: iron ABC transporter permease [Spirochaetaceae bacterium]|jgi:iron complex transport system permease protein|nr:iron ABC transporter permease [Spirochaetaceae bacterium]